MITNIIAIELKDGREPYTIALYSTDDRGRDNYLGFSWAGEDYEQAKRAGEKIARAVGVKFVVESVRS